MNKKYIIQIFSIGAIAGTILTVINPYMGAGAFVALLLLFIYSTTLKDTNGRKDDKI